MSVKNFEEGPAPVDQEPGNEEERPMRRFRIATFVTPSNGEEIKSGTTGEAPSAEDMEAEALGKLREMFPPSEGYSGHRVEIRERPELDKTRSYE